MRECNRNDEQFAYQIYTLGQIEILVLAHESWPVEHT